MNDTFEKRLRAAVGAGWRTLVIWAILMTASWLIFLILLHYRPGWLLDLWGGAGLTWPDVRNVAVWFFGAFKVVLWIFAMAVVFLALWLRRLSRAS